MFSSKVFKRKVTYSHPNLEIDTIFCTDYQDTNFEGTLMECPFRTFVHSIHEVSNGQ